MLEIGSIFFQQYHILQIISKGKYSTLYLAKCLDEFYTIKQIHHQKIAWNELSILKQIRHHHMVQLVNYYYKESLYLVFKYIPGIPLSDYLWHVESDHQVVQIALEIGKQLQYLHHFSPPILYGDLKPDNLIIGSDGIHLIDFGISRTIDKGDEFHMGTKGYYPLDDQKEDVFIDLYALGIIMYELSTKRSPLESLSIPSTKLGDMINKILHHHYKDVDTLMKDLKKLERKL